MLTLMKEKAHLIYLRRKENQRSKLRGKKENKYIKPLIEPGIILTKEEKIRIKNKWGEVVPIPLSRGYEFYRGMKSLYSFDANYLPSSYYAPYILNTLNHHIHKGRLNHKSLLQIIYSNGIKHPRTIIRSYGGLLLDENFRPLLRNEAVKTIKKQNIALLYKPSSGQGQGKGIQLLATTKDIEYLCNELESGELTRRGDFVIQEPLQQCDDTKVFNPTSLNCMRITTININNNTSPCSFALKCGSAASVVDNIGGGKRGVIVGIDLDGNLAEYGFYGNGEKATVHNGIEFKGKIIHHFDRVISAAVDLHKLADGCGIIGWDIALDKQYNPVLIEGNTGNPGISFEQMCSGPIFGNRTDEIINYIKRNK